MPISLRINARELNHVTAAKGQFRSPHMRQKEHGRVNFFKIRAGIWARLAFPPASLARWMAEPVEDDKGGGRGTAPSAAEQRVQRVDVRVPRTFPRHLKAHTILKLPKNKGQSAKSQLSTPGRTYVTHPASSRAPPTGEADAWFSQLGILY
jgi:hypothetical protein